MPPDEGSKCFYFPPLFFEYWLGLDGFTHYKDMLYLMLPIFASFPFADSFLQDKRTGYLKNVLVRADRKQYGVAKYFAVFVSSGAAALSPLLFDLMLTGSALPYLGPLPADSCYLPTLFGSMFYSTPVLYVLIFLLIDFVFFGSLACLALCISFYVENAFFVEMFPYIVYFLSYLLLSVFGLDHYAPISLLPPGQSSYAVMTSEALLCETCGLFLFTFLFFNLKIRKQEAF